MAKLEKKQKTIIFSLGILVFLLLAAGFIFLLPQAESDDRQAPETVASLLRGIGIQVSNQPVQPLDFTLQLLDGDSVTLSSLKGNVVLLNFWATWCPSCRQEKPSLNAFYQHFQNQGLEVFSINLRENPDDVRQFVQSNGYTLPVLLDLDGNVGSTYGVRAIPTTFIIDQSGMIIGRLVGSINWDSPQVFEVFEALLNNTL